MNIYQKLLAAQSEIGQLKKDSFVSTGKGSQGYKAVTHDNVTNATREALIKHGIFVRSSIINHTLEKIDGVNYKGEPKTSFLSVVEVQVDFINAEIPEEVVSQTSWGYGMDSQDKGIGKAYSYGHKYALLKGLSLWTGENEESRQEFVANSKKQSISNTLNTPSTDWVVPFGKFKGMKLREVDPIALGSYVDYIESTAATEGKEIKGVTKEFIEKATKVLS